MVNLMKMEVYHLLRNKFFYIAALLILAAPFITLSGFESQAGITGNEEIDALRVFTTMLLMSGFWIIAIGIIGAFFAGQSAESPAEKLAITAGHSRTSIFAAKAVSFLVLMNVLMLLFPVSGLCIELTRMPLYLWVRPDTISLYMGRVVMLTVFINCSVFSFILFLKFAFRKAGITAAVTALALFGQYILVAVLAQKSITLFWLPFTMQQCAVLVNTDLSEVLEIGAAALVYTLVFLCASYCVFHRREIK